MEAGGRVAVVIVNFNGASHLVDCLEALARQSFDDSFTVVFDNASTDGSDTRVEMDFPEVELIRSDSNIGFAAGSSEAIRECLERPGVEFILTLNNDVVMDEGCLAALVETLDKHSEIWSCQPKMYLGSRGEGTPVFNNAGILVWRDGSAFNRGIHEPDDGQYDNETEIFGTCAGCSLYRADALRHVGLFDESFFAYLEDVDLAWRGRLLGYESLLCTDAVCWHRHGASSMDTSRKIMLLEANRIRVLIKNYAASDILLSPGFTFYRFVALAAAALFRPASGSRIEVYRGSLGAFSTAGAIARGWARGLGCLPRCLIERKRFKHLGTIGSSGRRHLARRFSSPLWGLLSR